MRSRVEEGTSPINRSIGRKLRHARTLKGLTLEGLGKIMGVTHQQAQKYEAGRNTLSPEKLTALADALGVPVSYFFDAEKTDSDEGDGRQQTHFGRLIGRLRQVRRSHPQVFQAISRMVAAMVKAEE